jgi:hypothetical protein
VRTALVADGGGAALPRWRGRRWLISLQVAVSLALLSVATVMIDQFRKNLTHDTGMALDHIATAEVDFGSQHIDEIRARQVSAALVEILRQSPEVVAAAVSSGIPMADATPNGFIRLRESATKLGGYQKVLATTPGIFKTLDVGIRRGRPLREDDGPGSPSVAVLSEAAAKALYGSTDVVGREFELRFQPASGMADQGTTTRTIVGIAADTDTGSGGSRTAGVVYVPLAQQYWPHLMISARTNQDPGQFLPTLRRTIQAVDSSVGIGQVATGLVVTWASNPFYTITAGISGLLGAFALGLSLVGLYGALSHIVSRRTREMGLRLALGATARQVVQLVVRDGLRPVTIGVAIGLGTGILLRFGLRPMFAKILPAIDPFVVAIAPVTILIAGWLACYLPARRASRVDPNIALRDL